MTDLNDAVARAMGWTLDETVYAWPLGGPNWLTDEGIMLDCSLWQPATDSRDSWIVEGWLLDTIGAVTLVKLGGVYSVIWDDADMTHHEIHNENRLVAICEAAVQAGKNE